MRQSLALSLHQPYPKYDVHYNPPIVSFHVWSPTSPPHHNTNLCHTILPRLFHVNSSATRHPCRHVYTSIAHICHVPVATENCNKMFKYQMKYFQISHTCTYLLK